MYNGKRDSAQILIKAKIIININFILFVINNL